MSKIMRVVSVNVGLPQDVPWKGRTVTTAIYKKPIKGRIAVKKLNLDGDRQADLSVHGGVDKAVYAYPSEHYPFWRQELPGMDLPWGIFGENLTTQGLSEEDIYIGDQFRIGSVELVVTQPRLPCFKLGIRFGRSDIVKLFLARDRSGIYFAVLKEGKVKTGDTIEVIHRDRHHVSITDIFRLIGHDKKESGVLQRAIQVEVLPKKIRKYFSNQLKKN